MPDPLGIVLALASASVYAAYVLLSDRMLRGSIPSRSPRRHCRRRDGVPRLRLRERRGAIGGGIGLASVVVGAIVGTVFAVTAFLGGSGSSVPARRRCS